MSDLYRICHKACADDARIVGLLASRMLLPVDIEPAVRLYADWKGISWSDESMMESCRMQVRRLFDAVLVEVGEEQP